MADDVNQVFSDLNKLSPDDYVKQLGFEGPEAVMAKQMLMQNQMQQQAQQKYAGLVDQQYNQLAGQTGMDPYTKASLMFQAAGALAAPTRSGGFGESLGALGSQLAGPLMQQAQAERSRQDKLQQLQLARAKMATEMQSGPDMGKMLQLLKSQRDNEDEDETFRSQQVGTGTYALVSDKGTVKPIPPEITQTQGVDNQGLTGQAYLDSLKQTNPRIATIVQQISNGDVPPPTGRQAQTSEGKMVIDALSQYEPTSYSNILNGTRMKTAKDFTPGGTQGKVVGFAGKALDHLSQFQELTSKLGNVTSPIGTSTINAAKNAYERSSGGSNYSSAEQQREYVMTELSKFLKGGTPAEAEIRRNLESIDLNGSPEQIQAGIDNVKNLILGQVDPLVDQYKSAMGPRAESIEDGRDYLRKNIPIASKALTHIEENPIAGSNRYLQMQKQKRASAAQQQAPAESQQAAPSPDGQGWVVRNGVRIRLKPGQD
jgi:hypothetical protein